MIYEKLSAIQEELKAPKGQFNDYGNYKYRSAEDILEAVKPLCRKYKAVLMLNDTIEMAGERFYVRATVELRDLEDNDFIITEAYAREEDAKKGMDASQITGSSSSYARKYALNGMFCIDDTKDADTNEQHEVIAEAKKKETKEKAKAEQENDPIISHEKVEEITKIIRGKQTTIDVVLRIYGVEKLADLTESQYQNLLKKLEKTPNK